MRSSSPRVPRRAFVAGALSAALAACKKGDDTATEASIGPLLAPSALAARVDDIKGGKVAVLYVGPDALFGRGHVPGARNVGDRKSTRLNSSHLN